MNTDDCKGRQKNMRRAKALFFPVIYLAITIACTQGKQVLNTAPIKEGTYLFHSDLILESISMDDKHLFTYATNHLSLPYPEEPISWGQNDYWAVAKAFYESVWGETSTDLTIRKMLFVLDCEEVEAGPQVASFDLIHESSTSRTFFRISIQPSLNEMDFFVNQPRSVEKWAPVDLSKLSINVEDALRIVEEAGGESYRDRVVNACRIYINFSPYRHPDYWEVSYDTRLTGLVNIVTGEYEVLE